MADRFDKFTDRARRVLTLANEEALRFHHNYIGTEHLLLALTYQTDSTAAKVLAGLGVELHKVSAAVEFIIGRGDRSVLGEIGLTPRGKKVIELAVDEARRMKHHYIGTEHLLLGLVREGEGIAAGVLESLGVSLDRVRRVTLQTLKAGDAPPSELSAPLDPTRPARERAIRMAGFGSGMTLGMALSPQVRALLSDAFLEAKLRRSSEIEPFHVLTAMVNDDAFAEKLRASGADLIGLRRAVKAQDREESS